MESTQEYCNLVLGGGGVLGTEFCGAIEVLTRRGLMKSMRNFAGASAGSIFVGALACNASSSFLSSAMQNADYSSFLDYGNVLRAIYNFANYRGICPGTVFERWYENMIGQLTGNPLITLEEIHQKYEGTCAIVVTNIDLRCSETFTWRNKPRLTLVKAVRASVSIPGAFIPVIIDGYSYADGGILNNYPINVFHYNTQDGDKINPKTLGLMLVSTADSAGLIPVTFPKVTSIMTYLDSVIYCYMQRSQQMYLDKQDWARTIKLPCGNISSFQYNITIAQKQNLLKLGIQATNDHFNGTVPVVLQTQRAFNNRYACADSYAHAEDEANIVSKNLQPSREIVYKIRNVKTVRTQSGTCEYTISDDKSDDDHGKIVTLSVTDEGHIIWPDEMNAEITILADKNTKDTKKKTKASSVPIRRSKPLDIGTQFIFDNPL